MALQPCRAWCEGGTVNTRGGHFWLTPPEIKLQVRKLLGTDEWFDPCPYPRPEGWDALSSSWRKPWYLNPPFLTADGGGPMRFIRKAVNVGGPGAIIYPVNPATHFLLSAGATLYPAGRVRWLEIDTHAPMPSPGHCALAVLP